METQIWAHAKSGERYVVQVDGTGRVVAAAGPLHYSEIPGALAGDWDPDPEVTSDLQESPDDYADVTAAQRPN